MKRPLRMYGAELLEPRRLLATLVVNGSPGADVLVLEVDDLFIYAHMNGPAIPQPVVLWDDVQVNLFDGDDVVVIRNTRDEPVEIFLGSGADEITITEQSKDLDNIVGHVRVHAGLDDVDDRLKIHDELDAGADAYHIVEGSSQPMRLRKNTGGDKVQWGERDLTTQIFLNNADNTVTVDSSVSMAGQDEKIGVIGDGDSLNPTSSADALTFGGFISGDAEFAFSPGDGDDAMTVSGGNPFANGGTPILSFSGGDGADTMTVSGDVFTGAAEGTPTLRFTGGGFGGDDVLDLVDPLDTPIYEFDKQTTGPPTLTFRTISTVRGRFEYPGVETFDFDSTGTQASQFRIGVLSGNIDLNISAGGGDDTFELGAASNHIHYGIEVNVTVDGDAGDDSVTIDDNVATDHTHTLSGRIYDTDDLGQVDIRSTENVEFLLGAGDDSLTVSGTLLFDDLMINGGQGSDSFTITPDSGTPITVEGASPTTFPGDVLDLVAAGARGGVLTVGAAAGSGTYTFENRDPVVFTGFENFPTRPAPPLPPDLSAADDSGRSSLDNITNQLSLTFSGIGAASNSFVRLYRNGSQIATTTAVLSAYTFADVPFPAGDATFAMSATYDSPATGLTSTPSAVTNVRVDTIAPGLASPPDLQPGSDTGISDGDNITNDITPTFTVTAPELVRLEIGLTVVADYASPPDVTSSALADGAHGIRARSVDEAGNVSVLSSALIVTVDTTAPAAPNAAPDLTAASDTGISSIDNVTRDNTPTFIGTAPADQFVRLFDGTTLVGSDTTPAGSYSITSSTLSDGVRPIRARFEDVAGNLSAASPALNVTIDTVAPSAPAAAPDLAAGSDSGVSNTDNITNDNTPTFTGPGLGGGVVRLLANGVEVGFDHVTTFPFDYSIVSSALTDGNKAMAVRNEDLAGNPSASGPVLGVRIDTLAPQVGTAAFNFLTSQSLRYVFSEDVGPTLAVEDLTLRNMTTPGPVPTALSYAANVATFTWPGLPHATLGDGDYEARLARAGVSDIAGNALAADHLFDFFFVNGDANRDRRVNLSDFNILAANFGQPNRNFAQGDFNYDGTVNLSDFNLLAARFGNALAGAASNDDENRGALILE